MPSAQVGALAEVEPRLHLAPKATAVGARQSTLLGKRGERVRTLVTLSSFAKTARLRFVVLAKMLFASREIAAEDPVCWKQLGDPVPDLHRLPTVADLRRWRRFALIAAMADTIAITTVMRQDNKQETIVIGALEA